MRSCVPESLCSDNIYENVAGSSAASQLHCLLAVLCIGLINEMNFWAVNIVKPVQCGTTVGAKLLFLFLIATLVS